MASNAIGGGSIDAEGILKFLLHFYRTGYTRALNVTQRAAGANMSVDVNIDSSNFGGGLFMTTAGVPYFGYTNAAINATVATADPTNPRRDIVVAYIDLSLITTGTTNNLGAFKVKVVTGTAAASPSDPNAAAIQSSVGAGNPYIQLARVSLTAALGSITNAIITDLRTPAANAMPYLYGGSSNTVGHLVPNLADGTVVVTTGTGNVSTAMLADSGVTGAKLSTGAITLGYAQITSTFSGTSTSIADVTGLSVAVTIPAGGRRIKITVGTPFVISSSASGNGVNTYIYDSTAAALIGQQAYTNTANIAKNGNFVTTHVPAAGARTYKVQYKQDAAGTYQMSASATAPAFILVEAI